MKIIGFRITDNIERGPAIHAVLHISAGRPRRWGRVGGSANLDGGRSRLLRRAARAHRCKTFYVCCARAMCTCACY